MVRFEPKGHGPSPIIQGSHGYLKEHFDHNNFSKGIEEWIEKHNRYSTLEAKEGIKSNNQPLNLKSLISSDPYLRRKTLKALSFRMPCRPLLKFLWLYFLKFGFLDGQEGFVYCSLQAFYENMIVIKMEEVVQDQSKFEITTTGKYEKRK